MRKWSDDNNPKVIKISGDHPVMEIKEFHDREWHEYNGIPIIYFYMTSDKEWMTDFITDIIGDAIQNIAHLNNKKEIVFNLHDVEASTKYFKKKLKLQLDKAVSEAVEEFAKKVEEEVGEVLLNDGSGFYAYNRGVEDTVKKLRLSLKTLLKVKKTGEKSN